MAFRLPGIFKKTPKVFNPKPITAAGQQRLAGGMTSATKMSTQTYKTRSGAKLANIKSKLNIFKKTPKPITKPLQSQHQVVPFRRNLIKKNNIVSFRGRKL